MKNGMRPTVKDGVDKASSGEEEVEAEDERAGDSSKGSEGNVENGVEELMSGRLVRSAKS